MTQSRDPDAGERFLDELRLKVWAKLQRGLTTQAVEMGWVQDDLLRAAGITGDTLELTIMDGPGPGVRGLGEGFATNATKILPLRIQRVDEEDWVKLITNTAST